MNQKNSDQEKPTEAERKPNEQFGFHFSGFVKITDPQTGEVLITKRSE